MLKYFRCIQLGIYRPFIHDTYTVVFDVSWSFLAN